MLGRLVVSRAEPGFTLPAFERLAPPPPPDIVVARLEANSAPGDIVADLHGRGGWIARAAVDRQRRAFTLEGSPLTRLLAELVLRPPDLRHLDAGFSTLSASPRGESSLKLSIGELFATKCATCGRNVTADEFTWSTDASQAKKAYRCTICRDQQGGSEHRTAPLDDADVRRAKREVGGAAVRRRLRERFPVPDGGEPLVRAILDLHTDRQLVGLAAILDRIEGDLRAAPVESALRLAFLQAVLPASRLGGGAGRVPALKIAGGTIKTPIPDTWRERNPWLAFEEGYRTVRGFVQRLESSSIGPLEARLGSDLRSLVESPATAVIRVMTPTALANLATEAREPWREPGSRSPGRPRIRLVLGQPPARFSQERFGAAYHGTCWALGREAAALLPLEPLLGPAIRTPWSWQAATLRRSLEAIAPHLAVDGRAVLILESGGAEALVAAALGGIGAGYRLVEARLADADEEVGGIVELVPPGGTLPPGPRTRSNVMLEPADGGRGDPDMVPGPGLFAPPERVDARPFSAVEAARSIQETAVEVLRARGEPARYERLLGEILVGLDRSGQLRRLVASESRSRGGSLDGTDAARHVPAPELPEDGALDLDGSSDGFPLPPSLRATRGSHARGIDRATEPDARSGAGVGGSGGAGPSAGARAGSGVRRGGRVIASGVFPDLAPAPAQDPVERVLALVRDELGRPGQQRVVEIEPGRWWLREPQDLDGAAVPLADRVEWAVYSLLSTAGPIGEASFFERIAALFSGHDLPDEALVRACLSSYRSPASTEDRLVTNEDIRERTVEHTELLALLANGGHRLGMRVGLGRREQGRRIGERILADYLDERERNPWLPSLSRAPVDDLEQIDCVWSHRGRAVMLFEVEWTAMLGDVLLRRHANIRTNDAVARILAIPPERAELVRHKLEASPVLRSAIEDANWHLVLWSNLRAWLEREPVDLGSLEPYLGLDPAITRRAEQMGLFESK
jgi:hypothetical protein